MLKRNSGVDEEKHNQSTGILICVWNVTSVVLAKHSKYGYDASPKYCHFRDHGST